MVRQVRETMVRNWIAMALGLALVMGLGIHALATTVLARTAMPDLEGTWSAQVMEPGADGLVEETGSFNISFLEGQRFASVTPNGLKGHGTYEVKKGRLLRLQGEQGQTEVYSVLPLGEKVLSIYREGSRKAIYLVRN